MEMEEIRKVIGRNIREQREKSGISETALAFYLSITLKRLQKYESGDDSPTCDEIIQIATILKCSVDDLCKR